jgi:hypothetical protein
MTDRLPTSFSMALQLGDHVVAGEIINRRPYSTHGWLALRGDESPIIFQLTGNCSADLLGKHLRFQVPDDRPPPNNATPLDISQVARQQVGPTGEITIREVRTDSANPRAMAPCVYMEWYSQNGRVVLELVGPELEWVEEDEDDRQRSAAAAEASAGAADGATDDDIYVPDGDDADTDAMAEFNPFDVPPPDADLAAEDPYGLFPAGLDETLSGDDDAASATEEPRTKRSWDEVIPGIDPETKRMYEEWDEVTEGSLDVPFTEVFDPPIKVYSVEQLAALPDDEAESALKLLLARLALLGVAVAVCEHFSPRLAYRMIAEEVLPKYGVHPRLPQIGWVQHYDTSEFCRKCEERFDREYEERRQKEEQGGDEPPPSTDDDVPF